ncbi:MAG: hypothetical protein JWM72_2709 [Actinomycetia bacterium]|nr:hypothetical protein [Actinomycetes bacterium]
MALLSGTESLGNAAHHAWVEGLLTLVAGIGIGFVVDRTKRRFTTWAGAVAAGFGTLTVALDTAHISRTFGTSNVKLMGVSGPLRDATVGSVRRVGPVGVVATVTEWRAAVRADRPRRLLAAERIAVDPPRHNPPTTSAISSPAAVGFVATRTPAASRASIFACAVPLDPETMAPAWPIFLPGGAVTPAM